MTATTMTAANTPDRSALSMLSGTVLALITLVGLAVLMAPAMSAVM